MKMILLFVVLLNIKSMNDELVYYKEAVPLILSSNEFIEYKTSNNNYNVSSQILFYSNFDLFFQDELKRESDTVFNISEVFKNENELLKLNERKCGKIKIFFTEIKDNIFFAEIFQYKKAHINYENSPFFRTSFLYMFRIENRKTTLVAIKKIQHN